MKASLFLTSLMAALALATPLDKRYKVTRTVTRTATRYVTTTTLTSGGAASTTTSSSASLVVSSSLSSDYTVLSSSTSSTDSSVATSASITISSATSQNPSSASTTSTTSPSTTAASPTTSTVSSTSSTPAAASSTSSTYAQPILDQHNIHRDNHSAPAVTWSDSLAATAQEIAASCVYAHNTTADGGGYGQNIGAGAPPDGVPGLITDLMYNDEMENFSDLYGQANPDMSNFEGWGHFSQIVWKSTTQIGCYTQQCSTLQNVGAGVLPYFTVCNYSPAGNFAGEYGINVLPPLGNPVVII